LKDIPAKSSNIFFALKDCHQTGHINR